jgi:hypothetical protein
MALPSARTRGAHPLNLDVMHRFTSIRPTQKLDEMGILRRRQDAPISGALGHFRADSVDVGRSLVPKEHILVGFHDRYPDRRSLDDRCQQLSGMPQLLFDAFTLKDFGLKLLG